MEKIDGFSSRFSWKTATEEWSPRGYGAMVMVMNSHSLAAAILTESCCQRCLANRTVAKKYDLRVVNAPGSVRLGPPFRLANEVITTRGLK